MRRRLDSSTHIRLDRSSRELVRPDGIIRLEEKPFRVLVALVDARGEVVTRDTLKQCLWSDDTFVDFDNNLNSAVASLRSALGESARSPRFIETVPRIGYRWCAPRPRWRGTIRFAAASLLALGLAGLVTLMSPGEAKVDAPEAFQRGLYLRSQYHARRDPDLLRRARAAFREAAIEQPRYAPAVAEEADTTLELGFAGALGLRESLVSARTSARAAIELHPDNESALRVLALASLLLDWDFAGARRWLDRALDVSADQDARTALAEATYDAATGRHVDAARAAERAVSIDPAAYYVRADLAFFYLAAGLDELAANHAADVLRVAPDFAPAHAYALLANERLARWDMAAVSARALLELHGMGHETATEPRGWVELWRRLDLERVEALGSNATDRLALARALRYAMMDDRASALDALERAYAARAPMLVFLPSFPELTSLRGEPRFRRIERDLRRGVTSASTLSEPHVDSALGPGSVVRDIE